MARAGDRSRRYRPRHARAQRRRQGRKGGLRPRRRYGFDWSRRCFSSSRSNNPTEQVLTSIRKNEQNYGARNVVMRAGAQERFELAGPSVAEKQQVYPKSELSFECHKPVIAAEIQRYGPN